jgi:hypothetical protein
MCSVWQRYDALATDGDTGSASSARVFMLLISALKRLVTSHPVLRATLNRIFIGPPQLGQDREVSARMDTIVRPLLSPDTLSRGCEGYARLGVLRTNPGRADALRVLSMSCSDKIVCWSVLGIQGVPASLILAPIYIHVIIHGEIDNSM